MPQNPRNKVGRPIKPLLSRSKILTAGLELVDSEGLSSFSVQTLADKLGVTGPSVYHYFADRDDLLRGLGLLVLREMRDLHDLMPMLSTPRLAGIRTPSRSCSPGKLTETPPICLRSR
jgi:AcrR family transcriptional regulator